MHCVEMCWRILQRGGCLYKLGFALHRWTRHLPHNAWQLLRPLDWTKRNVMSTEERLLSDILWVPLERESRPTWSTSSGSVACDACISYFCVWIDMHLSVLTKLKLEIYTVFFSLAGEEMASMQLELLALVEAKELQSSLKTLHKNNCLMCFIMILQIDPLVIMIFIQRSSYPWKICYSCHCYFIIHR